MTDIRDPRRHRYGLGRLLAVDPRDRAFPMGAVLAMDADKWPKRDKPWRCGPTLNQGEEGACTGFSAAHWLMAEPIRTMTGPDAFTIYGEAQKRDPWKEVPHEGSTVRAAMQYLKELGHIQSYVWATDLATITEWLQRRGTCVLGTNWYRGMFRPDSEHMLRIGGPAIGGHAWHLVWFDEARGIYKMQNSWGPEWEGSEDGFAYISGEDLERLIHEDGEACAPAEQRLTRKRPGGAA